MVLIVIVGWVLTDKFVEPRLQQTKVDGDPDQLPSMEPLTDNERKGLRYALYVYVDCSSSFSGCGLAGKLSTGVPVQEN